LGESDFVEGILAQANERFTRQYALRRRGIGFAHVVARVAEICHLDPREVVAEGRQRRKVTARSLLCFGPCGSWPSAHDPGAPTGTESAGVSYAVERGDALVRENCYQLVT